MGINAGGGERSQWKRRDAGGQLCGRCWSGWVWGRRGRELIPLQDPGLQPKDKMPQLIQQNPVPVAAGRWGLGGCGRSNPAAQEPSAARGAAWGWGLRAALHARGVAEGTFQEGGPNVGLSALCSFSNPSSEQAPLHPLPPRNTSAFMAAGSKP